MAYESLKDKFLKNEAYLYGKNPLTSDEKDGWYLEIRPNSKYANGFAGNPYLDTRAVPVASAARDAVRVTKFLLSGKGLLFLGKQALLQTGNTFGQTRVLNPFFVAKQLVPFMHFPRHASNVPLFGALFGTSGPGPEPPGGLHTHRLQKETLRDVRVKVKSKMKIPKARRQSFSNIIGTITSPFTAITSVLGGSTIGADERPEIKFELESDWIDLERITQMQKVVEQTQNIRELVRRLSEEAATKVKNTTTFEFTGLPTRPEQTPGALGLSKLDINELVLTDLNMKFQQTLTEYISGVSGLNVKGLSLGSPLQTLSQARETIKTRPNTGVPTIKSEDSINKSLTINPGEESPDFIIFTIEAGGDLVQLRSFISDFSVTNKGEYKSTRYVGRYEKFITYQGVDRQLSVSFYLIAQSATELCVVWDKLDWLSRLVYPTKIQSAGYFEPPIAKFTMGRIFDRLPIYVTSVEWAIDENTTWDIDREVPQVIKVKMNVNIIESALNTLQNGMLYEASKCNRIFNTPPKVKTTTYVDPTTGGLKPAPTAFPTAGPLPPSILNNITPAVPDNTRVTPRRSQPPTPVDVTSIPSLSGIFR